MFTVVQNQQQFFGLEEVGERFGKWSARLLNHAESGGDLLRQQLRVGQVSQLYPAHTVCKGRSRGRICSELKCQSRLAAATSSRECQEPGSQKEPFDLKQLLLSANEPVQWAWEVDGECILSLRHGSALSAWSWAAFLNNIEVNNVSL
jgi:hypothetical protein